MIDQRKWSNQEGFQENRNRQQYSHSLVVKTGTINMYPVQGTKPAYRLWGIKENQNIKSKLVQKLNDENIWHVNITKRIIFQFFIDLDSFVVAVLVKFYCFTSQFVPNLEAKSVVPELATRYIMHCWWPSLSGTKTTAKHNKARALYIIPGKYCTLWKHRSWGHVLYPTI